MQSLARSSVPSVEMILFLLLFLAGASFHHPVEYDNTLSRYFLVSAVVDRGTLNIDAYQDRILDKSYWDGHYYSNKAAGAPMLAIPVYWCLRHLSPWRDAVPPLSRIDQYIVRIVTTTLPFAILGIVMYRLACAWGASPRRAYLMVLAYAFGSIALIHATMFSGHQMAACFTFFSFAILERQRLPAMPVPPGRQGYLPLLPHFAAGLCAGLAVLTDFTAVVIALFLTVYALLRRFGIRAKLSFLAGGGICIAALAAYNMACFGSALSLSYAHMTHSTFQKGAAKGLLGLTLPDPLALAALLASPSRGLFFTMPIFLLSLVGLAELSGRRDRLPSLLVMVAIIVGTILFVSGFYGWHGGWTFGPRYLVPVLQSH